MKIIAFISMSFAILFSSCSYSSDIVGKWKWDDGSTSEFFENGDIVIHDIINCTGKWKIEKDVLTITLSGFCAIPGNRVYRIKELNFNKMTLENVSNRRNFVCTKIKE